MTLINIVLVLIIVGFVCWLIQTAPIPIHPWVKSAIMGLIFIFVLFWLLSKLGVDTGINWRLR